MSYCNIFLLKIQFINLINRLLRFSFKGNALLVFLLFQYPVPVKHPDPA